MKLMIASDIHGSAKYCALMLQRFWEEKADKLLLLGDLLYHGPRNALPERYAPAEVADMLNRVKKHLICVRGNCDAEVDQVMLQFPILADYVVLMDAGKVIYAAHGHHANENNPLPMAKGEYLLCGHTHIPGITRHESFTYMNPGSVAIPKNGSCHSYMTLDDGKLFWKDIETGEAYLEDVLN